LLSADATNLTVADDADVGLMVKSGASASGDLSRVAYRTLTNKALDWEVVAHIQILMNDADYRKAGLMLMDSTSNRHIICGQMNEYAPFGIIKFASLSGYDGAIESITFKTQPSFFRATSVGTTLTFYVSHCGKNWIQVASTPVLDHFSARPDRIGFGYNISTTDPWQSSMTIDCFNLTGPAV